MPSIVHETAVEWIVTHGEVVAVDEWLKMDSVARDFLSQSSRLGTPPSNL